MIQNGAVVTYVGTWPPGNLFGFSDYTSAVLADLSGAGLAIRQNNSQNDLAQILGTPFKVNFKIQVQNGLGFNSTDDIVSVIRSYVYKESGSFPTADSVPDVQNPGGPIQLTGQPGPAASTSTAHACGDPSWGFFDDPGQWLTCLTTKGLSTIGLIAIGLAIGIAFILFAEHEA